MPTTQDYLNDLVIQKKRLAKCVSTCVECSEDETLNTIVPKAESSIENSFKYGAESVWDGIQNHGLRDNYNNAFSRWSGKGFSPKYPMAPTNCSSMFSEFASDDEEPFDASKLNLDTSNSAYFASMFQKANVSAVGVINTTASKTLSNLFQQATKLTTIEELILKDDGSQTIENMFASCFALKNIVITGKIGKTISFANASYLTKESIISIVESLKDDVTATITFNTTAINKAFETSEGAYDGASSSEWLALTNSKPTWTFNF